MKIYSDTLTTDDLYAAVPDGCELDTIKIGRPRKRQNGWQARLTKPGSRRRTNSGTHGAGDERAASYQDHGFWMAALYEKDPDAVIAHYTSRDDFVETTRRAAEWSGPRSDYSAPWLEKATV